MLIFMVQMTLPWNNIQGKQDIKAKMASVKKLKMSLTPEEICGDKTSNLILCNCIECLIPLLEYAYELQFDAQPDYEWI